MTPILRDLATGLLGTRYTLFFLVFALFMSGNNLSGTEKKTDTASPAQEVTPPEKPQPEDSEVTIAGKTETAFLSGKSCVYFEWNYGEKKDGEWVKWSKGFSSPGSLTIDIEDETADVPLNKVRLFLSPSFTKTFTADNIKTAPDVVQEWFSQEKKPVTVEEFILEAEKTYHAMRHQESFHLPPMGPGKRPERRTTTLLYISDQPFKDGKPQVPITPAYKNWSF